jgi:hypothetical protein
MAALVGRACGLGQLRADARHELCRGDASL